MSLQSGSKQILRAQVLSRGLLRPATLVPARAVSTQSMSEAENLELLNKQRSLRPNSPWHIYQPQLTSMTSIANRATGAALSVGFYAVFLDYVLAPAFGYQVDSTAIVQFVADLPSWFVMTVKSGAGFAFSYHTINGIRHLLWDTGRLLDLKTSYAAGYAVIASSIAATVGLLML
ncbi:cytochrome b subunit of succinate dehydrogenase, Sdh3p [Microbotryomycetes sp. JL201]|nr:cytochrome b subunit of succinate dehydrogenase, Sdh3p [Microbotryomycetes sp. JL201]